jgi:Tol biopolymer transport system component/serine/threonine protein kinase
MLLVAGAKLGPYEILAPLGMGGMGEVYKARDPRLDRLVAIKILLSDKLADAKRRQRFVQEAKAASALNHPNIITIHDIGNVDGMDFIVMELVNGESLDRMIPRTGMPVDQVLRIAVQIADALAKAHSAGFVHRDLKPANVMATPEGLVKVLDFGLAKLSQSEEAEPVGGEDETTSSLTPARTAGHTSQGVILGTVSYMSPEQAQGKPVDARSDIFSFGAVLFELLTGRKAFRGDTPIATISSILRDDPVGGGLPDVPAELSRIIARCLRKDPARRFQYMADAKIELEELIEETGSGKLAIEPAPTLRPKRLKRWLIPAAVIAALTLAFVGWRESKRQPGEIADFRPVPLTSYLGLEDNASFSPDGQQLAFSWNGEKQDNADIYVKLIGAGAPLRLTTDAASDTFPKWSPDGRGIAFIRDLGGDTFAVMWIPALGGIERRVTQLYTRSRNGMLFASLCWSPDSKYLVVSGSVRRNEPNRLYWLPIETGEPRPLTNPPPGDGDFGPALSPNGRTLAFVRGQGAATLWVEALSEGFQPIGEPRKLDTGDLVPKGPAWTNDGRELVFASPGGEDSILYRIAASGSGSATALAGAGIGVFNPAISSRGDRLAFTRAFRNANIWKLRLDRSASPATLIASSFRQAYPQYSPDGKRIAFFSNRGGTVQIWTSYADGSQPVQLTSMTGTTTGSPRWSPDGTQVSFDSDTGGHWQIYVVNADGGRPKQITNDASTNVISSWSRDGKWIYFGSDRSGRFEVWKAPPEGGAAIQVTHMGGSAPVESSDGKTLYFTKGDGTEGIWRMPLDGGQETQIVKSVYRYNFALTSDEIYFTPPPAADGTSSIQRLNLATRQLSQVMDINKPIDLGLAVSPNGRELVWAQLDYTGSDLVFVDGFR